MTSDDENFNETGRIAPMALHIGVDLPPPDYRALDAALIAACGRANLQASTCIKQPDRKHKSLRRGSTCRPGLRSAFHFAS
jgi:hypothetical protein